MCPPMISDSNDIECTRNGQRVNCSNSVLPDTVVKPKCKLTHVLPNGAVEIPIKLLCRQDGTWSGQLYKCVPSIILVLNYINYFNVSNDEQFWLTNSLIY